MASGYTFQKYNKELMARVMGRHLSISTKQSIEISKRIRNKPTSFAKRLLEDAIAHKRAIRYTRFNGDVGHKPGMAAGRYPEKSAKAFLTLIKSAEANAQAKGLNTGSLYIIHVNAQKASRPMHQGRQRGTQMKRTHVEIVVQERAEPQKKAKKATQKKAVQKPAPKQEKKAEEKPKPAPQEKKVETTQAPKEDKVETKKEAPKQEEAKVEEKVEQKPKEATEQKAQEKKE